MMAESVNIPKGTRDFGPEEMAKRNFIFGTIRDVFQKFGYLPMETPSMENLHVLTGKYGDEGDKLIFKILNSGNYLSKATPIPEGSDLFQTHIGGVSNESRKRLGQFTKDVCDRALRYDLTVPFARYVAMNHGNLAMPFKRFQIQPVWRADRPQKGRYQEFFQCDADVVGTESLICEAEIVLMINEVLGKLGINDFTIKINNRKILSGLTEFLNAPGQEVDLCVAIDKLDKIGADKVLEELKSKGFADSDLQTLQPLLESAGLDAAKKLLAGNETAKTGFDEIDTIFKHLKYFGIEKTNTEFDLTLARGLNYYTGAIFEVQVNNVSIGSISGGGRYNDLTGLFGLANMPGVGFSFGVDRIYDVLNELDLYPKESLNSTELLIVNFDAEGEEHSLGLLTKLRAAGIKSEIYPESAKMKKQMKYADKKNIPYVLLVGSREIESGEYTLKDMTKGEQTAYTIDKVIETIQA